MSESRGAVSMDAQELLRTLRDRGVELRVNGDRLSVIGPKGSVGPELQAAIGAAKAELIAALGSESSAATSVREDRLAPVQERVWLYQALEPESATYNHTFVVRTEGPLDVVRLEDALAAVIERHAPLRTCIVETPAGPRRAPISGTARAGFHDITHVAESERPAATRNIIRDQQAQPFDLKQDAPLRASLIRSSAELHDLVITVHHIAIDGVSVQRVMTELEAHYRGRPLPGLRATYDDYVADERSYWLRQRVDERVEFWEAYLDGAPRALELPVDYPASGAAAQEGSLLTAALPADALATLKAFAQQERASLFVVLLASYAAALHRATGQRDLLIGTPLHGRHRAEYGDLVGMFVNQAPLRARVPRGATLRELVRATRESVLAAMSDRELPFGMLVERLGVERDAQRTPLFQTMLNVLPVVNLQPDETDGVTFRLPPAEEMIVALDGQAKFDATVYAYERDGALQVAMSFNRGKYEPERMRSLLDDMLRIVSAGLDNPDSTLEDVLTLPSSTTHAASLRQLGGSTVVGQVLAWATQSPESVALEDSSQCVSYREVVERAGRIAALIEAKAHSDHAHPVGVLIPHGADAGVTLLGVLLSGRPYVPLDPSYPVDRLRYMIEDAAPGILIATEATWPLAETLSTGGVPVASIEDAASLAAQVTLPDPGDVAYLLYTSGSTGRPKAVVQSHRNMLAQAERYASALEIDGADRVALMASISFDAHLMDLWGGLIRGATVHFIDPRSLDLSLLPELVHRAQLTTLHVTPTVFGTLAQVASDASWPTVRAVVLGGEPVRAPHVEYFDRAFVPDAFLYNLYGASEHSFSIGHVIDRTSRSAEVPIGLPVGDVEAILLAEDGSEDAVRGELAIRSEHTALGYLSSTAAAERAFMPDPLRPGRVVYRTGDLARRRTDGLFVALGRVDNQVKVRGHRIEPAEVENLLRKHSSVRSAAVHAPRDESGSGVLTACVVPATEAGISVATLLEHCRARLPAYMVPTSWVVLDALPLTPSGKIDRRSLPAGEAQSSQHDYRGARTEEEQILTEIWIEVLGIDGVGVHQNFFEIGGNSLSAMQVIARIRDVLDVELPLRQFFDAPVISAIATTIRENRTGHTPLPPLRALASLPDRMPLSFSQERMWLLYQLAPESAAYNMTSAARLEGPLDIERLAAAVRMVGERQESLRTVFRTEQGRPMPVVLDESVELSFEDVSHLGEDAHSHACKQAIEVVERPYDLENGPLVRFVVYRLADDSHLVVIGMHHIIGDMWAFTVLGREIAAAYHDLGAARSRPLPLRYRDYAVWQRDWLQGDALEKQAGYWRERLAGVKALELPTDRSRPPFFENTGDVVIQPLSPELRRGVERLAIANHATPFMVTLGAFNALLASYSGQTDVTVGVPIANRTATGTEDVVGTFVNTLAHRNDLSGNPAFRELLARVRGTALDAFTHQDAPFELLVKELQVSRDTSRPPLVQVLFNVANVSTSATEIDGVERSVVTLERRAAQFELTMTVSLNALQSQVVLNYNTSLFSRATAERMLAQYMEMLERVVADPDVRLSDLGRPASVHRELLDDWNRTERDFDAPVSIAACVAAIAAERPNSIAVDSPTGSFTYAELVDYARRVTAALQSAGVGPGERVAVLMERSREMLGALLGILGSGAAYIPVDPAYPEARVRYVLDDSGVRVVVSHRGIHARMGIVTPVIDLDVWTPPAPGTFVDVAPEQPAYVIYTSGSTGKPKGVEVSHGAMANFLFAMRERPGLTQRDVLLAVTTISFDIAVLELYLPLIAGARVIIASEEEALDGRRLMQRIDEAGVTLMQATPATWKLLIAAGWKGKADLRILCGGEPLPRALADDLLDRIEELWNMYGPTETTVWSTLDRVERGDAITVGRPIANTTCYVLDDDLRQKPIGVPGELWIGGAGVANGYVNRPDLTAERFVDSPFRHGERIYRTGDLVRWRHDGRLEHLGRLDNQVKIRGFRIELGEVESALTSHAAVRDAVAAARDDRLVGYVVFEEGQTATTADLRSWVATTLPPYMVPSLIMPLDVLPLTPNGKVDRKALPEPDVSVDATHSWQPPTDPTEQEIAAIWSELLELDRIGVEDRFFEIGGHSLLAMEVVARIEERLGTRPEPRSLFFMTLGELAESVRQGQPA